MKSNDKESEAIDFGQVFEKELEEIASLRSKRLSPDYQAPAEEDPFKKALAMKLIGLAFSGGGIRSATFNLGILQAFAELKLLKQFDYLSTVSGGGYIGSWLTAWISREKSIDKVQEKLSSRITTGSKTEEHRQVFFLRQYSNYLTPKAGMFSADTWAAISAYLRNLSLNLGIFFPLFLMILLLPIIMISVFDASLFHSNITSLWFFIEAVTALGIGGFFISANLMYQPCAEAKAPWYTGEKSIMFVIVLPIIMSALLGSLWIWFNAEGLGSPKFLENEFRGAYQINKLCDALSRDGYAVPECSVNALNNLNLLQDPAIYAEAEKKKGQHISGRLTKLRKSYEKSKDKELLLQLNRTALEELYPHETPKNKNHWIVYVAIASGWYLLCWILGWLNAETYAVQDCNGSSYRGMSFMRKSSMTAINAVKRAGNRIKSSRNVSFQGKIICIASLLLSAVGWIFFLVVTWKLLGFLNPNDPANIWYVVAVGMPLIVLVYMAVITIQIGLMGRDAPEGDREWWSRLGALLFIVMFGWLGLFGIILAGPPILVLGKRLGILLIGSGWVSSTIAGLLVGKSSLTGKESSNKGIDLLAKIAPYVFVAGLLLFSSSILSGICISMSSDLWNDYWIALWGSELSVRGLFMINTFFMTRVDPYMFFNIFLVSLALFGILSWRVDINIFSLHLLYRNRLIRCYLGASNEERTPHPFYGFDAGDDIKLHEVRESKSYAGPYPIVNTAINLVGGKELAWQQRKAASFVFTPLFSGYEVIKAKKQKQSDAIRFINTLESGYQTTESYAKEGVMLGEAMAISGAAASPNMGYHTSRPLAFLMTVFNVRLGWWMGNSRFPVWIQKGSPWGIWYLFAELFGLTRDESKFVYLSDGGHFENLALYELIRRKCSVILLCDAGCDPKFTFSDLGNALRKVRVDFGVRIDMADGQLKAIADGKRHFAAGIIHYPAGEDGVADTGTLIYIKPTIAGDEHADVISYKKSDDQFPHQTTADQWFDESQFEAYRMLGYHSLRSVVGENWCGTTISDFVAATRRP